MKDLIKKILKEETEQVLMIPGLHYFTDGIDGLKNLIEKKNIKKWSLDDGLDLRKYEDDLTWLEGLVSVSGYLDLEAGQIESLPNLQSVGRFLDLRYTSIKSLDNLQSVGGYLDLKGASIESLPKLQSVGWGLDVRGTQIKSFGNLQSVGSLWLNKFLAEKYTDEEIRSMINVGGSIIR
jgi:hypothetical protein